MDRFQHIVRINLYGHTHNEDIQVTQSIGTNKNIGLNFYAGSLTTNVGKNPSFNVIQFDAEYMIPLNIFTYSFDLVQANLNNQPTWTLLHDYLTYYNIADMRPDNIRGIANAINITESLAIRYTWDRVRRAGPKPTSCDAECRHLLYCYMTCTETY